MKRNKGNNTCPKRYEKACPKAPPLVILQGSESLGFEGKPAVHWYIFIFAVNCGRPRLFLLDARFYSCLWRLLNAGSVWICSLCSVGLYSHSFIYSASSLAYIWVPAWERYLVYYAHYAFDVFGLLSLRAWLSITWVADLRARIGKYVVLQEYYWKLVSFRDTFQVVRYLVYIRCHGYQTVIFYIFLHFSCRPLCMFRGYPVLQQTRALNSPFFWSETPVHKSFHPLRVDRTFSELWWGRTWQFFSFSSWNVLQIG